MFTLTRGNSATSWVSENQAPVPRSSFREKWDEMPRSLWHSVCHPGGRPGETEQSEPRAVPRGWYAAFLLRAAGSGNLRMDVCDSQLFPQGGRSWRGAGRAGCCCASAHASTGSLRPMSLARRGKERKGEPARRCFAKTKLCTADICTVSQILNSFLWLLRSQGPSSISVTPVPELILQLRVYDRSETDAVCCRSPSNLLYVHFDPVQKNIRI